MATKANESTKLILKVETGVSASGQPAYSQRTFGNINPLTGNDDLFAIGTALAGLQSCPLGSINRQDAAALVND